MLWQLWQPRGQYYDFTLYLVEDRAQRQCRTFAFRSTYYVVSISRLIALMTEAGFENVRRFDDHFVQPLIVGTKPPT